MAYVMTKKEISKQHEEWIAKQYDGQRSRSSGGSNTDKGDVRIATTKTLFECKATGCPGEASKYTTIIRHLEKIADEAWTEGKNPALAMRYFCPDSPLAGPDGWLDLTVRLTSDDVRHHGD
jgi:hypothetical protein